MNRLDDLNGPLPRGEGDPGWKRLFEDAFEAPPPRVWDAIERELNREEDDRVLVIPFWSRPATWAWSAAASVALLLVGWWSLRTAPDQSIQTQNQVVKTQPTPSTPVNQSNSESADESLVASRGETGESAANQNRRTNGNDAPNNLKEGLAVHNTTRARSNKNGAHGATLSTETRQEELADQVPGSMKPTPDRLAMNQLSKSNTPAQLRQAQAAINQPGAGATDKGNDIIPPINNQRSAVPDAPSGQQVVAFAPEQKGTVGERAPMAAGSPAIEPLESKQFRQPTMYGTQRIVWFRPTDDLTSPTELSSEHRKAEKWASVSVMPSLFNPAVGLRPAITTYGNTYAYGNTSALVNGAASPSPSLKSQPETSIAYQVSAGRQLSEHWSIETGVGYLEARSTVDSPMQTMVVSLASGGQFSNLYADALKNSQSMDIGRFTNNAPSAGGTKQSPLQNSNVYDLQRTQMLSNNYTFVQIPVQMGYQLLPRKRFGMALLGGLLTNLFVRNTVNDQLSVTNSDGVYRPVTLSASTGVRFRYRPTKRWSASMAGLFQQALQRGTRQSTDLTIRPQTMGVSVGLDYHF